MTYKELLEFTRKNPNPFWNKEQHDKDVDYRYKTWITQQNLERAGKLQTHIKRP